MKAYKKKLSKKHELTLLKSYYIFSKQEFGWKLGMDDNPHMAGIDPVQQSINEFVFILEKSVILVPLA